MKNTITLTEYKDLRDAISYVWWFDTLTKEYIVLTSSLVIDMRTGKEVVSGKHNEQECEHYYDEETEAAVSFTQYHEARAYFNELVMAQLNQTEHQLYPLSN